MPYNSVTIFDEVQHDEEGSQSCERLGDNVRMYI